MDYKIQENMKTLQDMLLVGGDLSFKYANQINGYNNHSRNNGDMTNARLFSTLPHNSTTSNGTTTTTIKINNKNRSISSSGGSEGDDDDLDMDMMIDDHGSDGEGIIDSVVCTETTLKDKVKLNFSVDSILSGEVERRAANKRRAGNDQMQEFHTLSKSPRMDDGMDVDAMLNANSPIVRPLPMRYLQSPPSVTVPFMNPHLGHGNVAPGHLSQLFKYVATPTNNHHPSVTALAENLRNIQNLQHFHQHLNPLENLNIPGGYSTTSPTHSSDNSPNNLLSSKRKRSWSRAVFSQLQRKGLEIQFQIQKYITKPDRRKLAARLGLTDAQVKVWFQNRRMKWRHTRETRMNQDRCMQNKIKALGDKQPNVPKGDSCSTSDEDELYSISSGGDEIDVVAE